MQTIIASGQRDHAPTLPNIPPIPETRRLRDQAIEMACVADNVLADMSAFLAGIRALHSKKHQEDVMRLLDLAAAHAEEWGSYFEERRLGLAEGDRHAQP